MTDAETEPQVITIDGPAGAGKSTVARRLAGRLGLDFLDTGAMYRGVAAAVLERGIEPAEHELVAAIALELRIRFDWSADPPALKVDGRDMTHRIRDSDVTGAVSEVATNPDVRRVLVRAQRWIGAKHPRLVTEGRDQGSVVFPGALVKFYLDASPEVRARRRAEQLREAGKDADEQEILRQIIYRDQRDASRSDGPLICPPDAVVVDSSKMTLDGVVDQMVETVEAKLAKRSAKTAS